MKVVDVQAILHGVKSEFIGCTDGLPASDAPTGHPHREAGGIVVTAVAFLAHGCATELASPHHEGLFEETSGVKVFEKAGDG